MMTNASTIACRRAVRLWLMGVAALIFAIVMVGGATRVTGSGLSIVEWRPVTGTVPPLSPAGWQAEFDKYKTIPQYREQNRGMSLDEFKTIYWWEWTHRLLGRLVGVAFLLPFLWFLWRGTVEPGLRARLWSIFGLGALQGAVGWWMVSSGLADRVSVAHERLAFHFTLACIIYGAIVWTICGLTPAAAVAAPARIRRGALALLALVLVQIFVGALVAGLRGGLIYNDWPLMNGALVPAWAELTFHKPAWINLFDNALTVQFIHRLIAYALWIAAVLHVAQVARAQGEGPALTGAMALVVAITGQAAIGIFALWYQVPMSLALFHQAGAVAVLTVAVWHAQRLLPRRSEAAMPAAPIAQETR
jgi:cytochrome c oxidase assembly protein subunit 15